MCIRDSRWTVRLISRLGSKIRLNDTYAQAVVQSKDKETMQLWKTPGTTEVHIKLVAHSLHGIGYTDRYTIPVSYTHLDVYKRQATNSQ